MNILVWSTLMFNLATAILAVWVFAFLIAGRTIAYDSANPLELGIAICILALTAVAIVLQTRRIIKN